MSPFLRRGAPREVASPLTGWLLGCALAACGGGQPPPADGGACTTPAWTTVLGSLDRSVLSAFAGERGDVWAVGGGLGVPGRGALALRFDGTAWHELATGRGETLWWGFAVPGSGSAGSATDVWMVGEQGVILRYDGQRITVLPSGTTATLYGVWGSSASDVWIVGGVPGAGRSDSNDVVLHWDGQTLTRDTTLTPRGATLFKVWGAAADDLWVGGEGGLLWRRTAAGWQDQGRVLDTASNVLTVHGCSATEVYAVAGSSVYQFDGRTWSVVKAAPSGANGVSCGAAGVLVVGNGGTKLRYDRASATWTDHRRDDPWRTDFHGALSTPAGDLFAVGGNFLTPASVGTRNGVIGYFGCKTIASTISP